jgi:hypothetical protein
MRRGLQTAIAAAMAACGGGQAGAPPPSDVPVTVQGGPDVSADDGTDGDAPAGHAIVLPDAAPAADSGPARDGGRGPVIDAAPPADASAPPAKPASPTAPTLPHLMQADAGPGTDHPVTDAGVPRPQPFQPF